MTEKELAKHLFSEVEIVGDGGWLKSLKINGTEMIATTVTLRATPEAPPTLVLEVPVFDLKTLGGFRVQIGNAPKGSRLSIDDEGRMWIVPGDSP